MNKDYKKQIKDYKRERKELKKDMKLLKEDSLKYFKEKARIVVD